MLRGSIKKMVKIKFKSLNDECVYKVGLRTKREVESKKDSMLRRLNLVKYLIYRKDKHLYRNDIQKTIDSIEDLAFSFNIYFNDEKKIKHNFIVIANSRLGNFGLRLDNRVTYKKIKEIERLLYYLEMELNVMHVGDKLVEDREGILVNDIFTNIILKSIDLRLSWWD